MKAKRTLIAACIAGLFASGAVLAKDKWEYHEDGWNKTRSYGSVMVGEDSVDRWGPWEEFVEPAAGGPSIGFLGEGGSDPYKPIPNPIPPDVKACGDGEWCGYMAYSVKNKYEYTYWEWEQVWVKNEKGKGYHKEWQWVPHVGTYTTRSDLQPAEMRLQFVQPGVGDDWYGKGEISFLSDLPEFIDKVGSATELVPVKFFGKQGEFSTYNPYDNIVLYGEDQGKYYDPAGWWIFKWKDISPYATMGLLEVKLSSYVNGDSPQLYSIESNGETKVYAPYVAGQLTPLSDMASLRAIEARATYCGDTFSGGHVSMSVNFAGAGSWTGNWSGGALPTFSASGGISGATFASSSVTGTGINSAVSNVAGYFYGPQAAAAGGVADVTKYETRYVDVFLANKVYQTSGAKPE